MWSGSHKDKLKEHDQKFNEGNLLTRGQTVKNIPKEKTIPLILEAGQMSLHHPTVVHGSELNKSNDRRIGFVIQSYIGTNVKQVLGKNGVQLARGVDEFNYHEIIDRPQNLLEEKDIRLKKNKSMISKLTKAKKVRSQIIKLKQDINKPDFGRSN